MPGSRFPKSLSSRRLPRSSRPTCAIPGRLTREILISVDIGWRRINSSRCRARQPALLLLRAADVCKDTGSLPQTPPPPLAAVPATWRWTWSAPTPGNCISTGGDFYFVDALDPEEGVRKLAAIVQERIPKRFGLDPIRDVQVLCPMNRGGLGARSLNIEM